MSRRVTRLAPSPTGALHLGNARTFLINWALARAGGWSVVLRLEDLDGPRIKSEANEQTLDILQWLGLDWDEGPFIQSTDLTPYEKAMDRLAAGGLVYPCALTRKEIEAAASAPHEGERHETRYPPELRPTERPGAFTERGTNWRLVVDDRIVDFDDVFASRQTRRPGETIGDIVLWTKRGTPSYQLAVVVDDHRQGVTDVVRGDDLLDSAARQILLYRALELSPEPSYTHLPLVLGPDGRRLAKRHGDTRLSHYRELGVPAERLIGLLASWCGLARTPMSASEFADRFDLARLPSEPVTCSEEDDAWLRQST